MAPESVVCPSGNVLATTAWTPARRGFAGTQFQADSAEREKLHLNTEARPVAWDPTVESTKLRDNEIRPVVPDSGFSTAEPPMQSATDAREI